MTVTKIHQQEMPAILLRPYNDPPEPEQQTWGGLIEYILDQRAINAKHNEDKARLRELQ